MKKAKIPTAKEFSLLDLYGQKRTYSVTFPTDLDELRRMGAGPRGVLVAQLFAAYRPRIIEAFIYAHMPQEFQEEFARRSISHNPREAFKKTLIRLCRDEDTRATDLTHVVINHMKKTGAFSPSDLDEALGREATDKERRQIDKFLNALTDEQLAALMGGSEKDGEQTA